MQQLSIAADTGGFAGDMEVITPAGRSSLADLTAGTRVYTLDLGTRVAELATIRSLDRFAVDQLVAIETRRADLRVAVDQPIPFITPHVRSPRLVRAGQVDGRASYTFVNEWTRTPRPGVTQVDITDWLDGYEICAAFDGHGNTFRAALPDGCEPCRRNSHLGYYFDSETFTRHQAAIEATADRVTIHAGPNHRRRPYRFEANDFLRLLGWYITEGSVYWPTSSRTAQVKIAQETPSHRQALAALFDRLGIDVHRGARRFEFGSVLFGRLLECLCGPDSHTKRLPQFIWDCSAAQQRLLLKILLQGDGNDRGTYYTASRRLATDLLRLCLDCGVKPRYARHGEQWRLYVRDVNDGFRPAAHVRRIDASRLVCRPVVTTGDAIMIGRDGTFQWLGVANVS